MALYHTANSCNCAAAKQNSTVQLLCSSGLTSVSCLAISGNSCKFHRKLPLGDNLTTITCQDVTFAPHPSLMSAGLSGSPPLQNTATNTGRIRLRQDATIRNALLSNLSSIYSGSSLVLIRFRGFFSSPLACVLHCSLMANLPECLSSASLGSMCYITVFFQLTRLLYKEMSYESPPTLHHHGCVAELFASGFCPTRHG